MWFEVNISVGTLLLITANVLLLLILLSLEGVI